MGDEDARRRGPGRHPAEATPAPAAPRPGARQEDARAEAVARWLHLMRVVLPALSSGHGWPIHADHCFMRVCLDAAIGAPWHEQVRRPAVRHLDDAQLARAVAVAEAVAADPASLPALNRASLSMRGKARR